MSISVRYRNRFMRRNKKSVTTEATTATTELPTTTVTPAATTTTTEHHRRRETTITFVEKESRVLPYRCGNSYCYNNVMLNTNGQFAPPNTPCELSDSTTTATEAAASTNTNGQFAPQNSACELSDYFN